MKGAVTHKGPEYAKRDIARSLLEKEAAMQKCAAQQAYLHCSIRARRANGEMHRPRKAAIRFRESPWGYGLA